MYKPIEPIEVPGIKEVLLGVRGEVVDVGVVKHLEEEESVVAVNLGIPVRDIIGYRRSHVFYRLNEKPVKIRHNGTTADLEVYVDTFTFVQEGDVLKREGEIYPPVDVFRRDWGSGSYYQRFTMMYVYEGIVVERRSSMVWDGRHSKCIDREGVVVSGESRVSSVRGGVRNALNGVSIPKRTYSVGNAGITRKPENYSPAVNKVKYTNDIEEWLKENYNSRGIPLKPVSLVGLKTYTVTSNTGGTGSSGTDSSSTVEELVGVLSGNNFIEWAVLVTVSQSGGS